MTVTYPLTFPAIGIVSSNFGLSVSVAISQSPFTKRQQVYDNSGSMWQGDVTFERTRIADANLIKAFVVGLKGQFGTFLYGDPDFLALGPQGTASGTPLVDGASQTGTTLAVKGFGLSETVLKAGDYFQLGTGLTSRLYMITEDIASDGAGDATLHFLPALRSSPAGDDPLTITGAKGLMRLSDNTVGWSANFANIHDNSISFVEAISE